MEDSENAGGATGNQTSTSSQFESPLGRTYIGLGGVIAIMAYLVLFLALDLYVVIKVWPPALTRTATQTTQGVTTPNTAPSPSTTPAASSTPSANSPAKGDVQKPPTGNSGTTNSSSEGGIQKQTTEQDQGPWKISFLWEKEHEITLNESLFLLVMASGSLGALLRALRSFYWYAGNRELKWSWSSMYLLLPFTGGLVATVFYLIVRGGFVTKPPGNDTAFGFAALGALVGLFSEEAILKLKQISETVFTKSEPGKDTAGAPAKISGISPAKGPQTGGTAVTITGDNFLQGARVNFGSVPANVGVVTKTTIAVTTPAHATGAVDVEVINPDNHSDIRRGAYTYE